MPTTLNIYFTTAFNTLYWYGTDIVYLLVGCVLLYGTSACLLGFQ